MLFEHEQQLNRIEQKVDRIMAAQDDINAAVSAINSFLSDLSSDVQAIQTELANGGGGTVDTSALNAAVAQLPAAQSALDALANPAPAPVTGGSGDAPVTQ
jgi:ABC-type transporter Mla subunit MlaD